MLETMEYTIGLNIWAFFLLNQKNVYSNFQGIQIDSFGVPFAIFMRKGMDSDYLFLLCF